MIWIIIKFMKNHHCSFFIFSSRFFFSTRPDLSEKIKTTLQPYFRKNKWVGVKITCECDLCFCLLSVLLLFVFIFIYYLFHERNIEQNLPRDPNNKMKNGKWFLLIILFLIAKYPFECCCHRDDYRFISIQAEYIPLPILIDW